MLQILGGGVTPISVTGKFMIDAWALHNFSDSSLGPAISFDWEGHCPLKIISIMAGGIEGTDAYWEYTQLLTSDGDWALGFDMTFDTPGTFDCIICVFNPVENENEYAKFDGFATVSEKGGITSTYLVKD